ncbi:hypothetical protein N8I77_009766 [Diaporthe amygdali]|uniref:Uncharacterized protein n=1 Tax=Phomopsis amygdali TaxID=1214568 RepID=A0AAD9SBR0_PHOAM|nr:hypothetical protein N8I77_009766 [Diaporthe amygdali]
MQYDIIVAIAALVLSSKAGAARICGSSNATSTYQWRLSDARYDSAAPSDNGGPATLAVSIVPTNGSYGTFFECFAAWPDAWKGWQDGGDNIIWSNCIWAGNGFNIDNTVSFAVDWANKTMYVSHTFACSDAEGADGLATGILPLNMNCATTAEGSETCALVPSDSKGFTTKGGPTPQEPGSVCPGTADSYQSWQVEQWKRQYEWPPGSSLSDPPKADTGPAFVLRNMRTREAESFSCTNSGKIEDEKFTGTCVAADQASLSTAEFVFDRKLDMLTITQHWQCGEVSLDAVGVGYVQATCDRQSDLLTCTTGPIWIGTKTL